MDIGVVFISLLVFSLTIFTIVILRPVTIRCGLVDTPGGRKQHQAPIPIVGGLSMFLALTVGMLLMNFAQTHAAFLLSVSLLVCVGVVDDFYTITPKWRLVSQVVAALIVTVIGGNVLADLGDIFFLGNVSLGVLSIPFTVFAIVALINAINMLDGIDGLAGSILFVQFTVLAVLCALHGLNALLGLLMSLLAAIIAYLLFNLRIGQRAHAYIFMGDAGSMFLGFSLAWIYISLMHAPHAILSATTALWLTAVPVFDIVAVLLWRLLNGSPAMHAGRDHLHHVLKAHGYSNNHVVILICIAVILMSTIGLAGRVLGYSDNIMLWIYCMMFILYCAGLLCAKRRLDKCGLHSSFAGK